MKIVREEMERDTAGLGERVIITMTRSELDLLYRWTQTSSELHRQLRPLIEAQASIRDLEFPKYLKIRRLQELAEELGFPEIVQAAEQRVAKYAIRNTWGLREITVAVELSRNEIANLAKLGSAEYSAWPGYEEFKVFADEMASLLLGVVPNG